MARFFHVDRTLGLYDKQVISLRPYDLPEPRLMEQLGSMFPQGLSFHGKRYMLTDAASASPSHVIELIFEYARRADFPDKPSRLQGFLAFETLGDAIGFQSSHPGLSWLWEVECADWHRADMNLLALAGTGLSVAHSTRLYWSGSAGSDSPKWECILVPPVSVLARADPHAANPS